MPPGDIISEPDMTRTRPSPLRGVVVVALHGLVVLGLLAAIGDRGPTGASEGGSPLADPQLRALDDAQASSETRITEGRIAGLTRHRPFTAIAPAPATTRPVPIPVRLAVARMERVGNASVQTEDRRLRAVAALALGDVQRAVSQLEDLTAEPLQDARVHSDLAAAYLARAQAHGESQDVAWAVAAAERAVRVAPRLPEALFNRALALERLHLPEAAARAWTEYLTVDATSPWSAEARGHLDGLRPTGSGGLLQMAVADAIRAIGGDPAALQAAINRDPGAVRAALAERLDAWATSCLASAACPADAMPPLASAAEALHRAAPDRSALDWIAAVRRGSADDRRTLAEAYGRHRSGLNHYEGFEFEAARASFAAARQLLSSREPWSALALDSSLGLAGVLYHSQDFAAARALLEAIRASAAARGHVRVAARAGLLLGHIDVNTGNLTKGLDRYARAAADAESARDLDGQIDARISAAQTQSLLGDNSRSWATYVEALAMLPRVRSSRVRGALLDAAGLAAADAGLPEVARHIGEAAAAGAEADGIAASATEAHLRLARAFGLTGNVERARQAVAQARAWNAKASPMSAAYNEARAAAAEAELVAVPRSLGRHHPVRPGHRLLRTIRAPDRAAASPPGPGPRAPHPRTEGPGAARLRRGSGGRRDPDGVAPRLGPGHLVYRRDLRAGR